MRKGCCEIVEAVDCRNRRNCAVRVYKESILECNPRIKRGAIREYEFALNQKLPCHANVVQYLEFERRAVDHPSMGKGLGEIVATFEMELLPNGNLEKLLSFTAKPRSPPRLSTQARRELSNQILAGLNAIHEAGFVHRNLSTSKIVFDGNFTPKIVGFSDSAPLNGHLAMYRERKLGFAAPEVLVKTCDASPEADIFALGVIIFITVMGRKPF